MKPQNQIVLAQGMPDEGAQMVVECPMTSSFSASVPTQNKNVASTVKNVVSYVPRGVIQDIEGILLCGKSGKFVLVSGDDMCHR
mmetsp:Transcript_123596/g.184857  ORF Transcript_123596/g.184857 Transcript_123596/m.184857 type:complete len:84 (+) Transcript_123596:247-498(+)